MNAWKCLPLWEAAGRFSRSGDRGGARLCRRGDSAGGRQGADPAGPAPGEASGQTIGDRARRRPQDRLTAMLQGLRSSSRQDPTPQPFVLYATLVAGVGVALVALVPWTREWRVGSPPMFLVLSAFVLAGELLP